MKSRDQLVRDEQGTRERCRCTNLKYFGLANLSPGAQGRQSHRPTSEDSDGGSHPTRRGTPQGRPDVRDGSRRYSPKGETGALTGRRVAGQAAWILRDSCACGKRSMIFPVFNAAPPPRKGDTSGTVDWDNRPFVLAVDRDRPAPKILAIHSETLIVRDGHFVPVRPALDPRRASTRGPWDRASTPSSVR
jgi:hypothetical protein